MTIRRIAPVIALALAAMGLQGCVATVVGAGVGIATTAVVTTAKVGGAVVGAVIPDGDDEDEKDRKKKRGD